MNNNQKCIEIKNKRYKIIQEGKRVWLNYVFSTYENQIYEYEQQYHCEYIKLESQLLLNNPSVTNSTLFNHINEYINCRINRLKKEIYDKMSPFRRILLQNRQRSSSAQTTIGVSPEPYLDLMYNPFLRSQWNHLSLGMIFRLNMF